LMVKWAQLSPQWTAWLSHQWLAGREDPSPVAAAEWKSQEQKGRGKLAGGSRGTIAAPAAAAKSSTKPKNPKEFSFLFPFLASFVLLPCRLLNSWLQPLPDRAHRSAPRLSRPGWLPAAGRAEMSMAFCLLPFPPSSPLFFLPFLSSIPQSADQCHSFRFGFKGQCPKWTTQRTDEGSRTMEKGMKKNDGSRLGPISSNSWHFPVAVHPPLDRVDVISHSAAIASPAAERPVNGQ
jgi:hypothetical protein